jgi:hypothetical protein
MIDDIVQSFFGFLNWATTLRAAAVNQENHLFRRSSSGVTLAGGSSIKVA